MQSSGRKLLQAVPPIAQAVPGFDWQAWQGPAEFADLVRSEKGRWAEAVRLSGAKLD